MSYNFTNETTIDPLTMLPDNVTVPVTYNSTNITAGGIDSDIKYIDYITVPLIGIIGILGNTLTLAIMSSRHFRSSTTSVYLSAMAVSDTLFIVLSPFTKHFINKLIAIDIRALTQAGCKAFFCFYRASKICSTWYVVVICIERFIVVWFPLQAKIISTRSSAVFAVFAVTTTVFTLCGFLTMVDDIVNGVCIPYLSTPDTKQLSAGFLLASTVLFAIIPTTILVVFTPLTIIKLFRHQAFQKTMSANRGHQEALRVTKTLLSVMIAYLVLVTPIAVAHSVAFFSGDNIFESHNIEFVYFREIAQMLENMNYSINFFLYVVSSRSFRMRFYQMFGCLVKTNSLRSSINGPYVTDRGTIATISTSAN